jgi:hypothetical protein
MEDRRHQEIGQLFSDVGATLRSIKHHYAEFNWIFSGGDVVVGDGTSHREHRDGPWRAGAGVGRRALVRRRREPRLEDRQGCSSASTPTMGGKDTDRYPWLADRTS